METANGTLDSIVYEDAPVETANVITQLTAESGLSADEAAAAVSSNCEIVERDGNEYVVGLRKTAQSEALQINSLDEKPGEPTGEYFTGKMHGGEPEIVEGGPGLAVLEDVGHPQVPELGHDYYPREMPHTTRTDLEVVVRALSDPDYATLLIGETGVGKNVLIKKICEVCNWPTQRVNFGLGVDYESLVGRFAPSEGGADMDEMIAKAEDIAESSSSLSTASVMQSLSSQQSYFEFVSGILRQSARNGYMFVGDEINTVTGEITSSLHGVTEEQGSRELVVQDTSEVLTPDERFRFVGTMNPPDYAGTNTLNRAFQTRFYQIRIPYLAAEAERQIVLEKSHLGAHDNGKEIADTLIEIASTLRNMQATGTDDGGVLMTSLSSRDLIKIGNMICNPDGEEFMPPKGATKMIIKGLAAPGDWTSISTVIDKKKF